MLPIVMEAGCLNNRRWSGAVGFKMGTAIYHDLSESPMDDLVVHRIKEAIQEIIIHQDADSTVEAGGQRASRRSSRSRRNRNLGDRNLGDRNLGDRNLGDLGVRWPTRVSRRPSRGLPSSQGPSGVAMQTAPPPNSRQPPDGPSAASVADEPAAEAQAVQREAALMSQLAARRATPASHREQYEAASSSRSIVGAVETSAQIEDDVEYVLDI